MLLREQYRVYWEVDRILGNVSLSQNNLTKLTVLEIWTGEDLKKVGCYTCITTKQLSMQNVIAGIV
jgi:hypothetical protein